MATEQSPTETTSTTTTAAPAVVDPVLKEKIKNQVEFYFSDSNFPRDKFMRAQSALHPEGYIAISIVGSFKKVKDLSTDMALISDVLKESPKLQVSPDGKMVKRVAALPEEDTTTRRTIYAKGWPQDYTLEKAQEFFDKLGKVLCVRIRKDREGKFKGSLLVEFETEDEARAVLAKPPTLEGSNLVFQTKESWQQEKHEQKQKLSKSYKDKKGEKKKDGEEGSSEKGADKKRGHDEISFTPGLVLSIKGIGEGVQWEAIKTILAEYGDIGFVDFKNGEADGFVRYKNIESSNKALKELTESKREIGGKVPTVAVVTGEEESNFWKNVFANSKQQKGGRGGRGGRGGGRGGRGGGGKRQRR